MTRLAGIAVLLLSLGARAEGPRFSTGGLVLGLQYGPGLWALDRAHLASQVGLGEADLFVQDAKNSHTLSVRAGYNIMGHATAEAVLTATGWNVFDSSRGGAGFLAGLAHWHPLELVWPDQERPAPVDASVFFGAGYGIAGQHRGMDGLVFELGVDGDYYLMRGFALGAFVRGTLLNWSTFYIDYDGKNTVALPKGSGGAFWTLGVSLTFRVAPAP